MTDFIPLFPLKLVVFPGEHLNLHIFEPRYKQLIREVEANGTTFGIPAFIENKIMTYGTEIQLLEIVKKYDDGKLDIKTRGIGIFKIAEFHKQVSNKLYSGADINRIEFDESKADIDLNAKILKRLTELFKLLKIDKKVPKNSEHFNLYEIGHHVGFSLEQEYVFLTMLDRKERQAYLMEHMDRLIPVVSEMERLRKRVQLNGHFKDEKPPEV